MLHFLFWDLLIDNMYVALLLVWAGDYLMVLLRDKCGKRNVARKSNIPSIFLL